MFQAVITIPNPAVAISLLPAGAKDVAIQGLILQPRGTNNAKLFIGGAAVSTSAYMFAINPGDGSDNPPAPTPILMPTVSLGLLSQLYVIGTAGEILHVTYIPR